MLCLEIRESRHFFTQTKTGVPAEITCGISQSQTETFLLYCRGGVLTTTTALPTAPNINLKIYFRTFILSLYKNKYNHTHIRLEVHLIVNHGDLSSGNNIHSRFNFNFHAIDFNSLILFYLDLVLTNLSNQMLSATLDLSQQDAPLAYLFSCVFGEDEWTVARNFFLNDDVIRSLDMVCTLDQTCS